MFEIKCLCLFNRYLSAFRAIIHLKSRCAPSVSTYYKEVTGSGELLQNLTCIKTAFAHLFQK